MKRMINSNSNIMLRNEIYDFLDVLGGYTDYDQKVEDVMEEFNLPKDKAEDYVWNWSIQIAYNEE